MFAGQLGLRVPSEHSIQGLEFLDDSKLCRIRWQVHPGILVSLPNRSKFDESTSIVSCNRALWLRSYGDSDYAYT